MLTKEVFRTVYDSSPLSKGKLLCSHMVFYLIIVGDYNRIRVGTELVHGK